MAKIKSPPLLLADDIAMEATQKNRSNGVKLHATALAKKLGTSIDLVHVENLLLYPAPTRQYKPIIDRYFKEQKAKLAQGAGSLEVRTKSLFLNGEPANEILSLAAKRNSYELIALGTHGRTGVSRLVLGSVAEEVIRHARIPVMTVGPKAQEKGSEFLAGTQLKILIPTALTPNSTRAEEYGVTLAGRIGAEVIFFHSMHEALHPVLQTAFSVPNPPPALQEFFEDMKATCVKQLSAKAKKTFKRGIPASYTLDDKTINSSDAVLREVTRSGTSLIVMGTHGRSMLSGAFFGRTARDVILGASVPVVTVRSKKS